LSPLGAVFRCGDWGGIVVDGVPAAASSAIAASRSGVRAADGAHDALTPFVGVVVSIVVGKGK
jgi:hypothetical protein